MDFKFPDVGEGITEGKLVSWHVNVGEKIKSEQTVASIETDKAVVDIPSPVSGIVEKLSYKPGEVVFVGKTLMIINDGTGSSNSQNSNLVENTSFQKIEVPVAQVSSRILKQAVVEPSNNYNSINAKLGGDSNGKILAMPGVRKAARIKNINLSNINSSGHSGQILLSDINVKLSDITGVQNIEYNNYASKSSNSILERISGSSVSNTSSQNNNSSTIATFNNKDYSNILATPSTKQLARELNVDLTTITGTGNNGIITREDVLNASKSSSNSRKNTQVSVNVSKTETQISKSSAPNSSSNIVIDKSSQDTNGPFDIVKFTSTRNAIYKHMIESKNNVPHFTISDEVDITELFNFREKYKEHYEKQGIKLTYLPFIIKAVVDGLIKHPQVNSTVNDSAKEIVLKKYYNIGIATDTPEGLVVPVLKNANAKNISATANEINELSKKARDHKLSLNDINGGTFTITSLGNSFGQAFTPIINYPETAILGVGRIVEKPIIFNGAIVSRKIVTLSLSCDHRVIDGAEASRFMNDVKWNIENFETLLIQ